MYHWDLYGPLPVLWVSPQYLGYYALVTLSGSDILYVSICFDCFYMVSPRILFVSVEVLMIFWRVFSCLKYGYIWSSTSIKWVSPHYYGFQALILPFSAVVTVSLYIFSVVLISSLFVCFILTFCIFYMVSPRVLSMHWVHFMYK